MSVTQGDRQHTTRPFLLERPTNTNIAVTDTVPATATAIALGLFTTDDTPRSLGFNRNQLRAAGFTAQAGSAHVIPRLDRPTLVVVGLGPAPALSGHSRVGCG